MIDASQTEAAAGVVAALETLLYAIEDVYEPIVKRASAHSTAALSGAEEHVYSVAMDAVDAATINLPGEPSEGGIDWSPAERLTEELEAQISGVESVNAAVVEKAVASVENMVTAILPGNTDIFGALVRAISELVGGLLGSLEEAPDLWKALFDAFHGELGPRANPIGQWLTEMFARLIESANERREHPEDIRAILERSSGGQSMPAIASVEEYIAAVEKQPAAMRWFLNVASLFAGILPILNARIAGYISGVTQTSLAQTLTTPLSPAELAQLLRADKIGYPFATEHAARSGVSPELFKLKLDLTERRPDVTAVLTYWRYTQDDSILNVLREQGFSDPSIDVLKRVAFAEATPSDVVRFMARDVTDQNAVNVGQLDQDFSLKYDKALFDKAGVTEELARYYWRAHWQLPSPTMGYEMLHRGLITDAQLEELLKLADYAPAWVQHLKNISYNVPGRIDVRRMWEVGIITNRADLEKRYTDMGYNPVDASTIADFTEELANRSKTNALEQRTSTARNGILQSFMVGTVSRMFAENALTALGYQPARVTELIAGAVFNRERDKADRIRDAIGKTYVRGYATKEDSEARLTGYGFGDDERAFLFESWDLERELADDTEERRQQRDLSKTEIIDAYEDRITTREEAQRGLEAAGYDPDEANTLLTLADNKRQRADNSVTERAVHAAFVTRRMDASEARGALSGLGYLDTRIAALLTRWGIEREEKRPDISAAQLQKMLTLGIVPESRVEEMLLARGYLPEDVALMMTLYGTEQQMAIDKLEEQRRQFEIRERRLSEHGRARIGLTERSLDIRERQFDVREDAVQGRFEAAQDQQRLLQQQRLDTQTLLQASRLAAQTARDATAFEQSRIRQERTIQAQLEQQEKSIAAANARADAAIAARDRALAQQRELRLQSEAAQDARQTRQLAAQADRQQATIEAAVARAEQAQRAASALADQRADLQAELTELRAMLQEARDIRLEAQRIEREQRQEAAKARTETRAAARKDIAAADAAANAASMQALQLQQGAMVAEIESRFAALQAQLASNRAQSALNTKQAAERLLQAATPSSTLLGTAGY